MLKYLLFACLVAVVAAHLECGELQRLKVMQQWAQVYGIGNQRQALNRQLWDRIFQKAPEIIEMYFQRVRGDNIYSPDFTGHAARLMGGMDLAISQLFEPALSEAQVAHLKSQHTDYGIAEKYYDAVREELVRLVGEKIGQCFDKDAWEACTKVITAALK